MTSVRGEYGKETGIDRGVDNSPPPMMMMSICDNIHAVGGVGGGGDTASISIGVGFEILGGASACRNSGGGFAMIATDQDGTGAAPPLAASEFAPRQFAIQSQKVQ